MPPPIFSLDSDAADITPFASRRHYFRHAPAMPLPPPPPLMPPLLPLLLAFRYFRLAGYARDARIARRERSAAAAMPRCFMPLMLCRFRQLPADAVIFAADCCRFRREIFSFR